MSTNTRRIIDRLLPWCPGWERQSGRKNLLAVVEKAVNELYDIDQDGLIFRGEDGLPPFLITEDETFLYKVIGANLSTGTITREIAGFEHAFTCRKVKLVYRASDNLLIPVESIPGLSDTPATVRFIQNPGETTEKFGIEFYLTPPPILSEMIPLPIPRHFEEGVESYVLGYVEYRENGKASDRMAEFHQRWKPEFETLFHTSASLDCDETPIRHC